jgi:vancomycin resistance protein YoaR
MTMTALDIDLRLDLASLLNDAWNQGRYGNMLERWRQINALRDSPYQKNSDGIHYNEAKLNDILQQVQASFERAVVNAGVTYDPQAQGGYQYQQEQYGRRLDIEPVRKRIVESVRTLTSVTIPLEPETIEPEKKVENLRAENVLIVSVSTLIRERTGDEGRTHNVRLACEKLNGNQLDPGRKLSFNSVVGKRTEKNGFQEAREIAYGEYTVGIGGGVCQVSTTLYQAALRAGLKVDTRSVHALPSPYAEKGQDATVSDNGKDLVIRNSGQAPVYIKAWVEETKKEKRCYVEIYGTPLPDGIRYTLESQQVGMPLEANPPVKYIRDKKQEHVTWIGDEKQVVEAREGYKVDTYLVTKRNDGMEISRTKITTDTYPPRPAEIYQGVIAREGDW